MEMVKYMRLFLAVAVVAMSVSQSDAQYTVGTWYNFKTAALTYSFDDGCSNQIPNALPLFDKYGYKVSFNVVTNWASSWSPYITASNNGHEIASHTVTHATLSNLSAANQDPELKNSQATINANITNAKCLTIIYPNCNTGDITTMAKYYISGRTCSGQINSNTPTDFWNLSSVICGSSGSVSSAQNFNDKAAAAKSSKGWCIFLIHGIDGDGGYSSQSSSELSTHLAYINTNSVDYWVATQLNVVKYIKERVAASITETTITSDSLKMVLTDNLDNTIYDADLTIRRTMPTGWTKANVYLGTTLITSSLTTVNGVTYIQFNVAPDKGNVFISNPDATVKPPVVTPQTYCQNATASQLTAQGTSLKWYTVATGGTASSTAPTPSTATVGSTSYYVSQTVSNKESARAVIAVTVNVVPAAPTVTSPVNYAQNATSVALTANGTSLKWYTVAAGGTASTTAPVPSTATAGTTDYYVSQTTNTCESPRATVSVVVTANSIDLVAGWNIIGCPITGTTNMQKALSSIWSQVETLKSIDAFYSIDNTLPVFNSLSTVSWGQGYLVKVKTACTLDWVVK